MIDTAFAVSGKQLRHLSQTVTIESAGVRNDVPYVELSPPISRVAEVMRRHIQQVIDGVTVTISLEAIQAQLS